MEIEMTQPALGLPEFVPGRLQRDIIAGIAAAELQRAERRAAVLKHPDLARALCEPPLNYADPHQWNGWIPPAFTALGDEEICRSVGRGGAVRMNQLGRRASGAQANDSPRRYALLTLASEAWKREHSAPLEVP